MNLCKNMVCPQLLSGVVSSRLYVLDNDCYRGCGLSCGSVARSFELRPRISGITLKPVQRNAVRGRTLSLISRASTREEELAGNVRLRSEAEAPYRSLRLVLFGFFGVSASVGALIASTQLIAALGHAQNALPLQDVAQSLAIDLGAVLVFAFLLRNDLKAQAKQMARMTREERLGALRIQLANKKSVPLSTLRSFARVVLVAGTPEQVATALATAEPLKEQLLERGVLVVPLPIFGEGEVAGAPSKASSTPDDLRWRAEPLRMADWLAWFQEQAGMANARLENGLYIGLRLDGRVRASGTGPPPWARFVDELAPISGA